MTINLQIFWPNLQNLKISIINSLVLDIKNFKYFLLSIFFWSIVLSSYLHFGAKKNKDSAYRRRKTLEKKAK